MLINIMFGSLWLYDTLPHHWKLISQYDTTSRDSRYQHVWQLINHQRFTAVVACYMPGQMRHLTYTCVINNIQKQHVERFWAWPPRNCPWSRRTWRTHRRHPTCCEIWQSRTEANKWNSPCTAEKRNDKSDEFAKTYQEQQNMLPSIPT